MGWGWGGEYKTKTHSIKNLRIIVYSFPTPFPKNYLNFISFGVEPQTHGVWGREYKTKPNSIKNLEIIVYSFPKNYLKFTSFRVEFHETPNPSRILPSLIKYLKLHFSLS